MNPKRWVKLLQLFRRDRAPAPRRPFAPHVEALEARVVMDDNSAGPLGISARGLTGTNVLTGAGDFAIGQVELTRPGQPSSPVGDTVPQFAHADVNPAGILDASGAPVADHGIDAHAEMVAGIIIAKNPNSANMGVAPDATLYAAGVDLSAAQNVQQAYEQFAVALQLVEQSGDVRAINLSAGAALAGGGEADGNSLLTQFIDWSARTNDTLYVVAGVHGADGFPVPTDEYNGLTVAFTSADPITGVYQYVDGLNNTNHDAAGLRTSIDLVAPGRDIWMPTLGQEAYVQGGLENGYFGTSFAAPHVTGAVALLQQYADERIDSGTPGWGADARRHEVMKAVLMNSADKMEDTEGGRLLGMTRTIYKADGSSAWGSSDARDSIDNPAGQATPLDLEMGAGALNVSRALTQFRSGGFTPARISPLVGWSYDDLSSDGEVNKYPLTESLLGESYISITVTWDRVVSLQDPSANYAPGDLFAVQSLADLDVLLMPAGATRLDEAVWTSVSRDSNVEHMFFRLPEGNAEYEFWVRQRGDTGTRYAVAWWAVGVDTPDDGNDNEGGDSGNDSGGASGSGSGDGGSDGSSSDGGSDDSSSDEPTGPVSDGDSSSDGSGDSVGDQPSDGPSDPGPLDSGDISIGSGFFESSDPLNDFDSFDFYTPPTDGDSTSAEEIVNDSSNPPSDSDPFEFSTPPTDADSASETTPLEDASSESPSDPFADYAVLVDPMG